MRPGMRHGPIEWCFCATGSSSTAPGPRPPRSLSWTPPERSDVASGDAKTSRSGGSRSSTGRFARWLAGWRVAIRIARRDARRYKWRSALIVAMVGLPVLLLTGGITLLATNDISMAESVPRVMGSAQARIHDSGAGRQVAQSPDSRYVYTNGGADTLAVPGFASGSDWTTSKVQKLTGGRVIPTIDAWLRVTLGDSRPTMPVLGIDARDPLARGMTELVSGRWALSLIHISEPTRQAEISY